MGRDDASLCGDACNESRKFLEAKRDIPRINGSSNAFIVIVVCLVFIIIVAMVAILFLLRNERAFDVEQTRRSQREQSLTPLPFPNAVTRSTWSSQIVTFFVRVFQEIKNRVQKRGGMKKGWVRAENWETDTGMSVLGSSKVPEVASSGPSSLQNIHMSHSLSTLSRSTSGSLSSGHLNVYGICDSSSQQVISPLSHLPRIGSQLSDALLSTSLQSSNIHLQALSSHSIPLHVQFDSDSREYVGSFGMPMRTLRGGTKFVEAL